MKIKFFNFLTLIFLIISVFPPFSTTADEAVQEFSKQLIIGKVEDAQNQPISNVSITLNIANKEVIGVKSQSNGMFAINLPRELSGIIKLTFSHHHFKTETVIPKTLSSDNASGCSIVLPTIQLERHITIGFWIATTVFILVLILLASGWLHNTLAALLGISLLFLISYLGTPIFPDLYVFSFSQALSYLDWNVIFLIMGMMMVIAVVEETGVFQWLAYAAYRLSRGKLWLLLPILILITSIGSAILDNVTTMLLMTPIILRISIALKINPMGMLMPALMASNVAGISTLVGTPTNILIGSYGNISFNDFLFKQTPGVLAALFLLIIFSEIIYRKDLTKHTKLSEKMLKKLEASAKITNSAHLKKAGWVGLGMLLMFVLGEHIGLVPSVTAIIGATALMVWIRPDMEEMISAIDWTTLVFFMSLFIVVGAIQEVGLISFIASFISHLVGHNLVLAMMVIVWMSALLSTVIANIPFTAAMLPVIAYLTTTIPGADTKVLYYCLSVGAALGGNGSLLGASANMVTAGIAERAGYPITYFSFLKKGMPALFITVGIASLWLLIRFVW